MKIVEYKFVKETTTAIGFKALKPKKPKGFGWILYSSSFSDNVVIHFWKRINPFQNRIK